MPGQANLPVFSPAAPVAGRKVAPRASVAHEMPSPVTTSTARSWSRAQVGGCPARTRASSRVVAGVGRQVVVGVQPPEPHDHAREVGRQPCGVTATTRSPRAAIDTRATRAGTGRSSIDRMKLLTSLSWPTETASAPYPAASSGARAGGGQAPRRLGRSGEIGTGEGRGERGETRDLGRQRSRRPSARPIARRATTPPWECPITSIGTPGCGRGNGLRAERSAGRRPRRDRRPVSTAAYGRASIEPKRRIVGRVGHAAARRTRTATRHRARRRGRSVSTRSTDAESAVEPSPPTSTTIRRPAGRAGAAWRSACTCVVAPTVAPTARRTCATRTSGRSSTA